MEFVNNASYFEDRLVNRHREIKKEHKLKRYAKQILTGLKEIHDKQIIHADIKLPNLLLHKPTKEEKAAGALPIVKICDFGISQIIDP